MGVRMPFSMGSSELGSRAGDQPVVRFNILSDQRELDRMVSAVTLGAALLSDPAVKAVRNEVILPNGGQANALNRPSACNYLKSLGISTLYNLSGGLRRIALGDSLVSPEFLMRDPAAVRELVLRTAAPVHHACGTCRMGRTDDVMTVLDARCRVIGVTGLRVVDASVMPGIVSANTHLPVVMIAEKAASMIAEDRTTATKKSNTR